MFRKIVFLIAGILFSNYNSCYAQNYFSGIITYQTDYVAKNNSTNIDSLVKNKESDSSLYYIKRGYYKSVYYKNGNENYSYCFDHKSYKMHDIMKGNKIASWRDARTNDGEIYKKIVVKSDTVINGFKCDKLVCTSKEYNYTVYFSKEIKYDTTFFTGHKRADWGNSVMLTNGGISVLTVNEKENYTEYTRLIGVKSIELEDKEFILPDNIMLGASRGVLTQKAEVKGNIEDLYRCMYSILKYPSNAYNDKIEYTAYIKVLIDEKGNVEYFEQNDTDSYGFNHAAINAFKSCSSILRFKPGSIKDKKVKSVEYIPVWFKISK